MNTVFVTTINHVFLVTLRNPLTEDEVSIEIESRSDRFIDILREIQKVRADRGLKGYELFEAIELGVPF